MCQLANEEALILTSAIIDSARDHFRAIRSAEKILAGSEDWRVLGTDPTVHEALGR